MNEWEWQLLEDKNPVEFLEIDGMQVRRGDRVRLRPRAGGDVFDIALSGKVAAVARTISAGRTTTSPTWAFTACKALMEGGTSP